MNNPTMTESEASDAVGRMGPTGPGIDTEKSTVVIGFRRLVWADAIRRGGRL